MPGVDIAIKHGIIETEVISCFVLPEPINFGRQGFPRSWEFWNGCPYNRNRKVCLQKWGN